MQQRWEAFWQQVEQGFHHALSPFRMAAEALGYAPSDMQIWAFLVALFMFALAAPSTYGDYVLIRRRAYAVGKVVDIDTSGDSPDTPIIDFRDASGKVWRFDSSLPCNATTGTIGAEVRVIYDPLHPKRAREDGRSFAKAFAWLWWHAFAVGVLVIVFWPGLIEWQ